MQKVTRRAPLPPSDRRPWRARRVWLCALFILLAVPVCADVWAYLPLEVRVRHADLILRGQIVAEHDAPASSMPNSLLSHTTFSPDRETLAQLHWSQCLKGHPTTTTVPFVFARAEGRQLGDKGIFLLHWSAEDNAYRGDDPWSLQPDSAESRIREIMAVQARQVPHIDDHGHPFYVIPLSSKVAQGEDYLVEVEPGAGAAAATSELDYMVDGSPDARGVAEASGGYARIPALSFPEAGHHEISLTLRTGTSRQFVGTFPAERTSTHLKRESVADPDAADPPIRRTLLTLALKFSHDGRTLWRLDPPHLHRWDFQAGQAEQTIEDTYSIHLEQAHQGNLLSQNQVFEAVSGRKLDAAPWSELVHVAGSFGVEQAGKHAVVWEMQARHKLSRIPLPLIQESGELTISPDGTRLAVLNRSNLLTIYDVDRSCEVRSVPDVTAVAFSGAHRLIVGRKNGRVELDGETALWQPINEAVEAFKVDTSGVFLAVEGRHVLEVYHLRSRAKIFSAPFSSSRHPEFSQDSRKLAFTVNDEPLIYSLETGRCLAWLRGCLSGEHVRFDATGRLLLVGNDRHGVRWDLQRGVPGSAGAGPLWPEPNDQREVGRVGLLSPNGKLLARANESFVDIYDARSHQLLHQLGRQDAAALVWSPDGSQLAVGGFYGVRLWDVDTGLLVDSLGQSLTSSLAFSPDGRWLVQGLAYEASASIWDVPHRKLLVTLASYGPEWIARAPDGRFDCSAQARPYFLRYEAANLEHGLLARLFAGRSTRLEP